MRRYINQATRYTHPIRSTLLFDKFNGVIISDDNQCQRIIPYVYDKLERVSYGLSVEVAHKIEREYDLESYTPYTPDVKDLDGFDWFEPFYTKEMEEFLELSWNHNRAGTVNLVGNGEYLILTSNYGQLILTTHEGDWFCHQMSTVLFYKYVRNEKPVGFAETTTGLIFKDNKGFLAIEKWKK